MLEGTLRAKVAVTVVLALIVRVHTLVVPAHAPPQEAKVCVPSEVAVKVTDVPALTGEVHELPPQLKVIPPPLPGVVVMV
jgi:hypothetical protein